MKIWGEKPPWLCMQRWCRTLSVSDHASTLPLSHTRCTQCSQSPDKHHVFFCRRYHGYITSRIACLASCSHSYHHLNIHQQQKSPSITAPQYSTFDTFDPCIRSCQSVKMSQVHYARSHTESKSQRSHRTSMSTSSHSRGSSNAPADPPVPTYLLTPSIQQNSKESGRNNRHGTYSSSTAKSSNKNGRN